MKKLSYYFTIVSVLFLSSCGSIDVLTLDQLYPAEINFPESVKVVGVVNNMPSRPELKKNILKAGTLEGDGKMSAEALASSIADSRYFNQVIICDSSLQDKEASEFLSQSEVDYLAGMLNVDILFSFEKLSVDVRKEDFFVQEWRTSIPVITAEVSPEVAVYIPGRSNPLMVIAPKDTIRFDVNSRLSEKSLMDEVVRKVSETVTNKIVPYWKPSDRIFFNGGGVEMRDAAVYVREGNWEGARGEWMNLYNRLKKGSTKFKAAFNIALSYEMTGNIQEAQNWMNTASGLMTNDSLDRQVYSFYKKELDERASIYAKLNIQMNRFNDNF